MDDSLLKISNLKISFPYYGKNIQVVRGVDIEVKRGEILGILGESGSGKTVASTSILGLTGENGGKIDSGSICFCGKNLLSIKEKSLRKLIGEKISYICQNPVDSLNPYRRVGSQIEEVRKIHKEKCTKQMVINILKDVGLSDAEYIYDMYPMQLSGGQCQRIMIAMALINKSSLLIADEPTSSIDASLQALVLDLLRSINEKYGVSIIIITHNFDVVKYLCSRVVIMYGGLVMEEGNVEDVLCNPYHPYTKELISCAKSLDNNDKKLYTLEGKTPGAEELRDECPFYMRCKNKCGDCLIDIPELKHINSTRKVRCIKQQVIL